jgi:putative hydrolase of the HAD superfamily
MTSGCRMTDLRFALFDLDDTLYPARTGVWLAMRARMEQYMIERLGLPADGVSALRERYYRQYGTTLNGLRHEHHINEEEFLSFVHDVQLENYLSPNPALRHMLRSLFQRRVIFTNADVAHANRVLRLLGIEDCFEQIIDIQALGYFCKPDPRAYEHALSLLGAAAPECVFIDDTLRNLQAAHAAGMLTVWVAPEYQALPTGVHYLVTSVFELTQVLAAHQQNGSREAE